MSRLATSFVLGYHGCDASVARRAVLHGARILQSDRDYDWLGPGAYFWEADPERAREWATWKFQRREIEEVAVIGAVIDLGNCLDLVARENIELVRAAYHAFVKVRKKAGLAIPKNKSPKGVQDKDMLLRFLDCAVLRHLHASIADNTSIEPFDTVRGMFVEGEKAFPGSGINLRNHVQIAVRNPACIKGVFYPTNMISPIP